MRALLVLLLAVVPMAFPAKKPPQPKPPMIQVLEASAHREQDQLNIDGKLKNTGERPAPDLVVIVDVLDSDKQPLITKKGSSDPETIEAGQPGEFHAQMPLPPRAVYIRLSFEEGNTRDIKAANTGPFAIE